VGTHARRVGSHELNKDSSRSHSMLILHVDGTAVTGDPVTTFGKVNTHTAHPVMRMHNISPSRHPYYGPRQTWTSRALFESM